MRFRTAKRVVTKWARGLGHYTEDGRWHTVLTAHHKLEDYYRRRGVDTSRAGPIQLRGLPYKGLPGLPRP